MHYFRLIRSAAALLFALFAAAVFAQSTQKVQAENGVLTSGMTVNTTYAGYEGSGYVCCFANTGEGVTVTFTGVTAGTHELRIRYRSTALQENTVVINGVSRTEQFPATNNAWVVKTIPGLNLNAGSNTVAIVKDWGWIVVDYFEISGGSSSNTGGGGTPTAIQVQAEAATWSGSGVSVKTDVSGYQGSGFIGNFSNNGDTLTVNFPNVVAGSYDIRIRYHAWGAQENTVSVNGAARTVQFPATHPNWSHATISGVQLPAGSNTVVITKDWGWINVDLVEIVPTGTGTGGNGSGTPVTKIQAENATLSGSGMSVQTQTTGYEGNGYVCCFSNGGDQLSATFTNVAAGTYNVRVRYYWPNNQVNNVVINGTSHSVQFPPTSTWADAFVNNVTLPAGNTTVAVTRDWGWMSVDFIELQPVGSGGTTPTPTSTITLRQPNGPSEDLLQVGNNNHAYWIEDNPWGAGNLTRGTYTGLNGTQFESQYGRSPTVGPNGEVAWRSSWKWPTGTTEVKSYPSAVFGAKPGWYSSWTTPGGHQIRLLDETVSQTSPSGATPGTFLPMPANGSLPTINSSFSYKHLTTPTGRGQLTYDLWLQSSPQQANGFGAAPITHEIMIPLDYWGNYGAHNGGRNPGWYSHDVTLNGLLWHVYFVRNFPGGNWTFIVFEPSAPLPPNVVHTLNLSAFVNHIRTRVDSNGVPWANGTEHLVSVELGVEPVEGVGDIEVSNYRVWRP
jgi:hypothetical protein